MNKRKLFFRSIVAIVVVGAIYRYFSSQPEKQLFHLTGQTMGTIVYNVKYLSKDELIEQSNIDSVLIRFNQSLSTYIPDSEISLLNQTGSLENPSQLFKDVLKGSFDVFNNVKGAFDPTIGPLVNAWGFGPDKKPNIPDSTFIQKSLLDVGLEKVSQAEDVISMDTSMYIDFSAIAKGYAVDLVAQYLEQYAIDNYMVEIGGEVSAKGSNDLEETWKIGVENPLVARDEQKLLAIVKLSDMSMATSGNYRNYYELEGRIIAHTIDPRTGMNTNHNLLSASVFASDCMSADAYATAFMVLGLEESKKIVESSDIEAFFVFQKEDGVLSSYVSKGLREYVTLNNAEN
ncbi:MAG: FAD:protein FMN transferase [Cyclobacteriaceae bacterium]